MQEIGQQTKSLSLQVHDSTTQLRTLNANLEGSSKSADRNATSMNYLTSVLAVAALAQLMVGGAELWSKQQEQKTRSACYQTVLQMSDIDLNYKNCLRDHGLSE